MSSLRTVKGELLGAGEMSSTPPLDSGLGFGLIFNRVERKANKEIQKNNAEARTTACKDLANAQVLGRRRALQHALAEQELYFEELLEMSRRNVEKRNTEMRIDLIQSMATKVRSALEVYKTDPECPVLKRAYDATMKEFERYCQ